MRWAIFLFCSLFLAVTAVGAGAPLFATDLAGRQAYPDDRPYPPDVLTERDVLAFCDEQSYICRKVCRLRFRDDLIGCPQSCESRVARCVKTACFRWLEPDFLIAERFGGFQCAY